jgi:hypothetical protein
MTYCEEHGDVSAACSDCLNELMSNRDDFILLADKLARERDQALRERDKGQVKITELAAKLLDELPRRNRLIEERILMERERDEARALLLSAEAALVSKKEWRAVAERERDEARAVAREVAALAWNAEEVDGVRLKDLEAAHPWLRAEGER